MADINPFRYRGYYQDNETGFYYLQTRYYDPEIKRFINADNYELLPQLSGALGQLNLYSYCNNNPVMYTDRTGQIALIDDIIVWGFIALFALISMTLIEIQFHPIETTLNFLADGVVSLVEATSKGISSITNYFFAKIGKYKRKIAAPRIKNNSRKKAYQKAFIKGGKIKPRGPEDHGFGQHFHPRDPKFEHWHYYFSVISLFEHDDCDCSLCLFYGGYIYG